MTNKQRLYIVTILVIIFLSAVSIQLAYLQIFSSTYKVQAEMYSTREIVVYPSRGILFDRNGKTLAYNSPVYNLILNFPFDNSQWDTAFLYKLLACTKQKFDSMLMEAKQNQYRNQAILYPRLSEKQKVQISEHLHELVGLSIQLNLSRKYATNAGGHVLGYLNEVSQKTIKSDTNNYYRPGDPIGRSGFEAFYEKELRGTKGKEFLNVNASGQILGPLREGKYDTKPISGKNAYLTIDIKLQELAEKMLRGKIGSIVAIDPSNGDILVMASSPSFPPANLSADSAGKYYGKYALSEKKPLLNRSISAVYSPGSTFKPFMGLLGLKAGIINPYSRFSCNYGFKIGRSRVRCHGHLPMPDLAYSITTSCNSYYCNVMKRYMTDAQFENIEEAYSHWYHQLSEMGIGLKLGVDIPGEKNGTLKKADYYKNLVGKVISKWTYGNTLSLSIGQGELGLTPLQMVNMACILANRGHYHQPHILKRFEGESSFAAKKIEVGMPKENFEFIINGMVDVYKRGTATASNFGTFSKAGKTGTIQNPHGEDHSGFICFAPVENPKIAVAGIIENGGYGSKWAAPIATLLMAKYLESTDTVNQVFAYQAQVEYLSNQRIYYPNYATKK